jgi:hypothetical protein
VKISRKVLSLVAMGSLAAAMALVLNHGAGASTATPQQSGDFTAAQVLAGIQQNMTTANKVNSKPHINTMTRAMNVNVYQVAVRSSVTRRPRTTRPRRTTTPASWVRRR